MVEKKDIEKLIIQSKTSNLKNHWKDSFFYNTTKYSGEIKHNKLLIWRSSHFLRGAFPIFRLTFDQNNTLNGIQTEKNQYHKLRNKITIGFLILAVLALLLTTELRTAIFGIIVIFIITFLLHSVMSNINTYETKILTEELKEAIEYIEHLKNPELKPAPKTESIKVKLKEWTFTKVLTRLLLYPFCFLIIWFSIAVFISEGKTFYGIFGIIVALAYPFADILLIFKNK